MLLKIMFLEKHSNLQIQRVSNGAISLCFAVALFGTSSPAIADSTAKELQKEAEKMLQYERYDAALTMIEKAILKDPNRSSLYLTKAKIYDDMGKASAAIANYTLAAEKDPKNFEAYRMRGKLYATQKEFDKAIKDFSKSIEIQPNFKGGYADRALTYEITKNYQKAIDDYTMTINTTDTVRDWYWNHRAKCYVMLKQYEKAASDYGQALKIKPASYEAVHGRARMYEFLNKPDLALIDYTNCLKIHPDDPDAHIKRGDLYFKRGNFQKAIDDFNMAMDAEVDESPFIYEKRAKALRKLGKIDQAVKDEKKAEQLRQQAAVPKI